MVTRILMQRNEELARFEVDPTSGAAHVVSVLEAGQAHPSLAWLTSENCDESMHRFLRRRSISGNRNDRERIVAACGAKSALDLVLKGHGLSLSDRYWYRAPGSTQRWEDINFFENEWDQSFGAAVLAGDYARLATCSPDVPDVTTPGHAVKTWERTSDGIFMVKAPERADCAEVVGAQLASDMCGLLFGRDDYVPVSTQQRYGKSCTVSPLMLQPDEELIDGDQMCLMAGIHHGNAKDSDNAERCSDCIQAYEAMGIKDASAYVARMACCSCLSLLADFHPGNFGAIHKISSDVWRVAPIFDFDGSFGFPPNDVSILSMCANPMLAMLLCVQAFSYLDSSWDWSWYNPRALDGFEDHIVEAYAAYSSLPDNFCELVKGLFISQREYVNSIAVQG